MIEIVKLTDCDLEECVDLFIDTFTKAPWYDEYDSRDQVVKYFKTYMSSNFFLGYVLKDNGKILSLSIGEKKPWVNGVEYYIDEFCVKSDCQRKGYGSKLLEFIKNELESEGLDGIILNTERGYPSEKFYIKNGFKELKGLITLAI